ncbi:unnamed protein product [Rodentolepis nana]|uniref:Non-specific protein-tyrosine kinase n=1 Tax=Rodentolepis nana TaxID=102285 RepID=A0A0R3TLD1_RODNA|nr:unnamed protein product [Rodentolepis nana]
MEFDRSVPTISLNSSCADNGQPKAETYSQSPATISIKGSSEIAVNLSTPETADIPERSSTSQPSGFISFFSNRQRKTSGAPTISIVSVKQSRLLCVAKIDESIQAVDDLLDFHNRAIKAENKVSNALWHTVQYCKSRKSDSYFRNSSQGSCNGSQSNVPSSFFRGDNNVDSGISEMTTESSPFPLSNSIQSSSLSQAKQFLQCFVDANECRAKIATCRASFHKKVTTYQLQLVSETLQRLRSLYIDLDTKLETYSSQLESDVRECWRKYAKYADNVTRLRTRLNSLLEKGMANKRKAIETAVNDLDGATVKLHLAHNAYTLSLITARQYHQWLVTRLQPCLYRNLNRCLRLADYSISYLLRLVRIDQAPKGTFDFIAPPDSDPLGDMGLDAELLSDGMEALGEDTFRRAFPFDADLLVRAGDDSLQPDKIIVNQMTAYHVQKL